MTKLHGFARYRLHGLHITHFVSGSFDLAWAMTFVRHVVFQRAPS